MNNDSKVERERSVDRAEHEGRELERAAIVHWLRERVSSWRRFPQSVTISETAQRTSNSIADAIEGLAAAIERGSHAR